MSKIQIVPKTESVKVIIRCRPFTRQEEIDQRKIAVKVNEDKGEIQIMKSSGDEQPRNFTFDRVYGLASKQEVIFDENAQPIIKFVCEGYNGTIFCYGQTGTGKTFTMEGLDEVP